jgi:hypothetical protein
MQKLPCKQDLCIVGILFSNKTSVVVLEEFVETELAQSLGRISNSGRSPSLHQTSETGFESHFSGSPAEDFLESLDGSSEFLGVSLKKKYRILV